MGWPSVVELCGGDERADGGPTREMIFSAESDGPDHTLDRIVVEVGCVS